MFSEIMKYRFLCQIRSKESIFWLLLFPIILSLLFQASLSDILKGEKFETVKIAVVDDELYEKEEVMQQIISSVSAQTKEDTTENTLFITQYVSREEADELLLNKKIAGYIYVTEDGFHLTVNENGIEQTIIKTFLDISVQKEQMLTDIISENNGMMPENISEIMNDKTDYIKDIGERENEPDTSVVFFYSILGMACMYGAVTGCDGISNILTGQSALAKRNNTSPVSGMKIFLANFTVDMLMNIALNLIILGFIRFVIGVNFGDRYGLIILTSVIGAVNGLSFGYLFGSVSNKSMNFKTNMVVGISMLGSFLAGMMDNKIKYIVKQKAFIIDRINPVNLITEGYYKLYYYKELDKYFENIIILCVMTGIFIVGTVFILKYKNKNIALERS